MLKNLYKQSFLFICLITFVFTEGLQAQLSLPADITALVVDLKYSKRQGVKICEMQLLSESRLRGYTFVTEMPGVIQERFCQVIQQYHLQGPHWFFGVRIQDEEFKHRLHEYGWNEFFNQKLKSDQLFPGSYCDKLENPEDFGSYQGVVYLRPFVKERKYKLLAVPYKDLFLLSAVEFYKKHPDLLLIDAAFFPYLDDKYSVNALLAADPASNALKPKWHAYPKRYSAHLAKKIMDDIDSDFLVLKPRTLARGEGILIVHKKDLDKTLQAVLNHKRIDQKDLNAKLYQDWSIDRKSSFIVEEFAISDPVQVQHLDNQLYDGTMRVVVVLAYHNQTIDMHFLGGYWKLPNSSLNSCASFINKHKSYGKIPYFAPVEPDILEEVELQLREGLPAAYKNMLNNIEETKSYLNKEKLGRASLPEINPHRCEDEDTEELEQDLLPEANSHSCDDEGF